MTLTLTILIAATASYLMALAAPLLPHWKLAGGFLGFTLSYNPGFAFSLSLPSPWQEMLIGIALIAVIATAISNAKTRETAIAYGMIIGGALANIVDRFIHGAVTDYFVVGTFPVFNLADAMISLGAGLLVIIMIEEQRRNAKRK